MPKWWPWGRSSRTAPDPVATAARPEPTWHRLPVIQRTVGRLRPRHRGGLQRFADHRAEPGTDGPAGGALREAPRTVAGWTRCATRSARPLTNRTVPPRRPSNNKWSRSCRSRRAHLGSVPAVQRAADVTDSPRELHPIEASSPGEPQPDSLIAARSRSISGSWMATDDSSSDGAWSQESLPSSPTAEESAAVPDTGDMDSASTTAAVAPVPSLLTTLSTVPPTAPASTQAVRCGISHRSSVPSPETTGRRTRLQRCRYPLCAPQIHQADNGATTRRMRGPHRPAAANRRCSGHRRWTGPRYRNGHHPAVALSADTTARTGKAAAAAHYRRRSTGNYETIRDGATSYALHLVRTDRPGQIAPS